MISLRDIVIRSDNGPNVNTPPSEHKKKHNSEGDKKKENTGKVYAARVHQNPVGKSYRPAQEEMIVKL